MAKIQLELAALSKIIPEPSTTLSRTAQVAEKRALIYQFRNQLLGQQLKVNLQNTDFAKTEYGKPYLIDHPNFHFNHSHSQQHYVLATSEKIAHLGVDIEDLQRRVRFESLALHAFHPEELKNWQLENQDSAYWFKIWTTKEAVLKASGLGIRLDLKDLNTQCLADQNGGMCEHPKLGVFAYHNIQLPHVMLTVAWQSEQSCKGFNFPQIELKQYA